MPLPAVLLIELRLAFQSSARPSSRTRILRIGFSTYQPLLKRKKTPPRPSNTQLVPSKDAAARSLAGVNSPVQGQQSGKTNVTTVSRTEDSGNSKDLIPSPNKPTSVSNPQRVDAPARIIPKAQATPEVTLTPSERLQLEFVTRRPPKAEPRKLFKQRLLIYHAGLGRTRFLSILKVSTIFVSFVVVTIWVPAYYTYGSPLWKTILILLGGTVPFLFVNFSTRSFVTWIHLVLPLFARQSPKTALEYARNLPANAMLHVSFMRSTTLPAHVEVNIADLVPTKSRWSQLATFEWIGNRVDKGTWYRPNPTTFYVKPESGKGKAARDTLPGVWESVYKRLSGVESEAVARWRR